MTGLSRSRAYGILVLRVTVGIVFLWAGLSKVFGAEPFSAAGFLQFGTSGTSGWPFVAMEEGANPTAAFWASLAANQGAMSVINFLVPFGQIAIGLALIAGVATRFAGAMGFLMMAFISIASWDFAHGVFNQTVVLAITALVLGMMKAGEVYGIDAIVDEQPIVKRAPALRYVLG
jgi:thiosulfate dehydrogenase [quinone] large subunit